MTHQTNGNESNFNLKNMKKDRQTHKQTNTNQNNQKPTPNIRHASKTHGEREQKKHAHKAN
jgi:hypothetical protein